MSEVRIRGEDDLRAFLQTRDRADALAIAVRVALRKLPDIFENREEPQGDTALLIMRALFASQVVSIQIFNYKEIKVNHLANSVASASLYAAGFADSIKSSEISSTADIVASVASTAGFAIGANGFSKFSLPFAINNIPKNCDFVQNDINFLFNNNNKNKFLSTQPLWHEEQPERSIRNWSHFKSYILAHEDENWQFWIDWYESQLAGIDPATVDQALEEDILLIPEEIWEAGPAVVNSEIARLVREHSRKTQEETVSPDIGVEGGKVALVRNPEADIADDPARIPDLLVRLHDAIGDLLDLLALKANACPVAVPPLVRYRDHLDRHGPRLMLGSLNDRHAVVKDEYADLRRDGFFDAERGLRRAFLTFLQLHKELREAFTIDALREKAIRDYRLDRGAVDGAGLRDVLDTVAAETAAMAADGLATEEVPEYVAELADAMRLALDTPEPHAPAPLPPDDPPTDPVPGETLWPVRILLKGAAFAARFHRFLTDPVGTVASVVGIVGFLDSDRGQKLLQGLRDIQDAVYGKDDGAEDG